MLKTLGGSTKGSHTNLSMKHGTKVQKKFIMTALPSTSQYCVTSEVVHN